MMAATARRERESESEMKKKSETDSGEKKNRQVNGKAIKANPLQNTQTTSIYLDTHK